MRRWVMSANSKFFDHRRAFEEQGFVDWKQTRKYQEGDIVFIYATKPESKIQYVTKVEMANMPFDKTVDQETYWKTKNHIVDRNANYCRLRLLKKIDEAKLGIEYLRKHGLTYAPQSPCKVKDELETYILSIVGDPLW